VFLQKQKKLHIFCNENDLNRIYRTKGGKALGDLHEIYNDYAEDIFKYLMCLCHDADLSEELTQETFYQAVRSIDRYNGECKMSVWLCQIAKHSYYKYLEKHKKQRKDILQDNTLQPSPEAELIQSENKISLYRSIHLLEEPYKEVVLLRMLGGLSFREIGDIQLKSENWARVTFYRAKNKLRERGKMEYE
jgi:RNA polymerase sigma factor (sigma-70 family)